MTGNRTMINFRHHGIPPYTVAVIHGGPGAPGEMAPVARELASVRGVIEPLQTATTLQGQVDELSAVLGDHAAPPVTLIGFSWGAWLSFIVAAGQPGLVSKLILVGSGPFEESYAAEIMETRLNRLTGEERTCALSLLRSLEHGAAGDDTQLAVFGALMSQADTYHPIADQSGEAEPVACCADTFRTVWTEAAEMRRSGRLLELGRQITCPVLAIHGDYDSHPAEGVLKPLSGAVRDFRFALLAHCGHKPWIEQEARSRFFEILAQELA
jgi:pimeloyl-ACP methyl ester carboxylesterase